MTIKQGLTPFSLFALRTIGVLVFYYAFGFLIYAADCIADSLFHFIQGG